MDLPDMASPRDDSPQLQVQAYKKGDIVWVRYRNKEYLGKINAYYPKERKVSHIWFPLNRSSIKQSAIFKADISKVRPFSLNDELPGDASEELQYSFDQVNRLLTTGISEEQLIEEFEQSKAEQEAAKQNTGSAKRKSTADLLKKVTGGTAKSTPKTPKSAGKAKEMPQKQPLAPVFQPGEQIIVDTQIGMWPGIFESYVDGHPDTIRYSLFPRKTSQEILIGQKDSIIPFPLDNIESSINEGNGSDVLMEALRDALAYVRERIAHNAGSSKQQPPPAVARTPKETKNQHEAVTPKENIRKTPSVTAEKQKTLASASAAGRLSEKRKIVQDVPKPTVTSATDSSQSSMSPSQPAVKRRKVNIPSQDEDGTEEERQLALFPARSGISSPSKSTSNSYVASSMNQSTNGHMAESSPQQQPKEEGKPNKQPTAPHKKQSGLGKQVMVVQPIEKRSTFELVISEEAHQHLRQVWSTIDEDWFKEQVNMEFFQMDFRNGGMLSFKEIEKVFTEVQQWIKMSHVMPTLTHLREMYYIGTYVLPELCAFALSKERGISMAEAKRIYKEQRITQNKKSPGPSSQNNNANSLDTLVMAANMMKGVETQNGGSTGTP